jgi:iron-sulfur cluster repair protein YtfE (RIC family)
MKMEIYDLLKQEHKKVQKIFKQLKGKESESHPKKELLSELQQELMMHMEGEEKLLYPVLEKSKETHEKTLEGFEEHNVAKTVLKELLGMKNINDDKWAAKLSVLQELVDHHVKEEEEELFKKAKKVLDKSQATEIAKLYTEEKEKQMATA